MSHNGPFISPSSSSPRSEGNKQLCISPAVGSGADSPDSTCPYVVPPSALTFAAIWDPEDGMVTFSGAHLLDSSDEYESSSGAITPPDVSDDDVSQVATVEHTSDSEDNTATTETSQDAFKAFLHRVPRNSRSHKQLKHSNTLASSTLDGLDVFSRDPVVPMKPRLTLLRKVSSKCFGKVDEKDELSLNWKPRGAFTEISSESDHASDEGFLEDLSSVKGRPELKSHWSVTTTSTSAYVEVPHMSEKAAESQSHIPHPLWIADMDQPVSNLTTPPNTPRRRLRKRRPSGFSSPSHSSSSSDSTSPVSPSSPISPSRSLRSKRSRRLIKPSMDDNWVCIDIAPFITQQVVEET